MFKETSAQIVLFIVQQISVKGVDHGMRLGWMTKVYTPKEMGPGMPCHPWRADPVSGSKAIHVFFMLIGSTHFGDEPV